MLLHGWPATYTVHHCTTGHRVGVRVVVAVHTGVVCGSIGVIWIKNWEAGAYWKHTQLWDVPMLPRQTNEEREGERQV